MGFAHGALYPAEAKEMLNRTWAYMVEQVEQGLSFLPTWLTEIIGNVALCAPLVLAPVGMMVAVIGVAIPERAMLS
jgi:hypothetical protein